jgi:hypothetical protein
MTDLPFTFEGGSPLVAHVAVEGVRYTVRVAMTLLSLRTAGARNADGTPQIAIGAGFTSVVEVEGAPAVASKQEMQ